MELLTVLPTRPTGPNEGLISLSNNASGKLLHRSVLLVRVTSLADQELFDFKQGITI
jgi:hypothetical protein